MEKWKTLFGADARKEVVAGLTGFFAISYIIIVNPMNPTLRT